MIKMVAINVGNEGMSYYRARKNMLDTASYLGGIAKIVFGALTVFYMVFVKHGNALRTAI